MNKYIATFLLLCASIIWGTAFVPQTAAMEIMGPHTFTGIRLIFGGTIILPFLFFIKKKSFILKSNDIIILSLLGVALWLGTTLQQIALIYTKVANVAFLTALYVPAIPLLLYIIFKKVTSLKIILAIILCVLGTWILIDETPEIGYFGDFLAIIGAFFWSIHIILISEAAKRKINPFITAVTHIIFAGLIALTFAFIFEQPNFDKINEGLFELIYTGFLSIGVGFTLQTIAQTHAPSTHAAIIFSMESVFASIAAYLILGQILGHESIIGSGFILVGVIISQFVYLNNSKLY